MEIGAVVIVLHGGRYSLGSGETSTLDSFMNVPGLALGKLRGKLRAASEGDEIEITDDAERAALFETLQVASHDRPHFTGELPALLKAARKPIT